VTTMARRRAATIAWRFTSIRRNIPHARDGVKQMTRL
jgi:hypothetical protein